MNLGEKTQKEDKAKEARLGCDPGDFQEMFDKMGKCCAAPGGYPDCSSMMRHMMEAKKNHSCRK